MESAREVLYLDLDGLKMKVFLMQCDGCENLVVLKFCLNVLGSSSNIDFSSHLSKIVLFLQVLQHYQVNTLCQVVDA